MKIGFFDSGLGGLTIFNKAIKNIQAEFVYFADNKNNPYGIKPKEDVKKYVFDNIKTLVSLNCDIIVIACNTATSVAINELREKYKNICIIGTEPAVKVAVDGSKLKKNILVSATTMTLNEEKLNNLIKDLEAEEIVQKVALDKLVEFAESGNISSEEVKVYLKSRFKGYDLENFNYLVLGCTHFPLFINEIKEVLPKHIQIVDGSDGVVKNICKSIDKNKIKIQNDEEIKVKLLLTEEDNNFIENFKRISNINDIEVEII